MEIFPHPYSIASKRFLCTFHKLFVEKYQKKKGKICLAVNLFLYMLPYTTLWIDSLVIFIYLQNVFFTFHMLFVENCQHCKNMSYNQFAHMRGPWTEIKKALPQCGSDTSSCPGPYQMAAYLEFHIGCKLDWELFTLPSYFVDWSSTNVYFPGYKINNHSSIFKH
jgi:hypothetical protein